MKEMVRDHGPASVEGAGWSRAGWTLGIGALLALAFIGWAHPAGAPADPRYMGDFEFIKNTVRSRSASLRRRKIDWPGACERLQPLFATCTSDTDHVKNVRQLLAVLEDSHTGVVRSSVDMSRLPSKWDGLYGGGLWFAWEDGRIMLRGIMSGHPQEKALPLGSVLVEIGGEPAWWTVVQERRRITTYQGSSSDHSLFSSMGNRFLPFGDQEEIALSFLTPELEIRKVRVRRWGPGGKAFYPYTVQLPEGLDHRAGAVSTLMKTPWSDKVGYLRITGSMDDATKAAFHGAFDQLKGMEALLLDCRGMGGGSDYPAWEMAGRFFERAVPNGPGRRLEPSGSWQFTGPVVMLQDESEVSSAETFTWAVSETERVVSVGRPTGGWGIIPTIFKCPSGLVDFRLGVNDRPTPIRGIRTEGTGWPPDIEIPYGPVFCARRDPVREMGMEVLRLLHAGIPRKDVVGSFRQLMGGDATGFTRIAARFARVAKGWEPKGLAKLVLDDLKATLAVEMALLTSRDVPVPDAGSASRRFEVLAPLAKKARLSGAASNLKKAISALRSEAAAQEALLALLGQATPPSQKEKAAFLRRYGKTRVARLLK